MWIGEVDADAAGARSQVPVVGLPEAVGNDGRHFRRRRSVPAKSHVGVAAGGFSHFDMHPKGFQPGSAERTGLRALVDRSDDGVGDESPKARKEQLLYDLEVLVPIPHCLRSGPPRLVQTRDRGGFVAAFATLFLPKPERIAFNLWFWIGQGCDPPLVDTHGREEAPTVDIDPGDGVHRAGLQIDLQHLEDVEEVGTPFDWQFEGGLPGDESLPEGVEHRRREVGPRAVPEEQEPRRGGAPLVVLELPDHQTARSP